MNRTHRATPFHQQRLRRPHIVTLCLWIISLAHAASSAAIGNNDEEAWLGMQASASPNTSSRMLAQRHNGSGSGTWLLTQQLMPDFTDQNAPGVDVRYGHSVAIDGDWMIVGTPKRLRPNGQEAGAVFIYRRNDDHWTRTQRILFGAGSSAHCGHSVALRGRFAIVGCPGYSSGGLAHTGRTILYARNETGHYGQETVLGGVDPGDQCGHAVAIDGNGAVDETFVAIGCVGRGHENGGSRGEVEIHRLISTEPGQAPAWTRDNAFTTAMTPDQANLGFGWALAMQRGNNGDIRLAIGMPGNAPQLGAAYVLTRTHLGEWSTDSIITAPIASYRFGCSLALDGNYLAIGHPYGSVAHPAGEVFVYHRNSGAWSTSALILGVPADTPNLANASGFGTTLSMRNAMLWVASPNWALEGIHHGYVWGFQRSGTGMIGDQPLSFDHTAYLQPWQANGETGFSLASDVNGNTVIGAPGHPDADPDAPRGLVLVLKPDGIFGNGFQ